MAHKENNGMCEQRNETRKQQWMQSKKEKKKKKENSFNEVMPENKQPPPN